MKQLTEEIRNSLTNNELLLEIKKLSEIDPAYVHGDVTLSNAFERFEILKDIVLNSIDRGTFDDIAFNRRSVILNVLQDLNQNRTIQDQVIAQIERLHDEITISGLFYRGLGKKNYEEELKDISALKRKYSNLLQQFGDTEKNLEFIQNKKNELEQLLKDAGDVKTKISELKINSDDAVGKINENIISANQQMEQLKQTESEIKIKIRETQEDIEKKQLQITTFYNNIEEYKTSIQTLDTKAKEIIAKEEEINKLIRSAERALQLKSAEGISAAFSAQYDSANKKGILIGWLIGACAFVLIAMLLTIWIVTGWGIPSNSEISSLIGRVVAVGIAITGAAFCAKQYIRQKNLADDYAYKAVLSKSIVAFTEEIKKRDEAQVSGYLIKVLDEIYKDPLRARDKKGENNAGLTVKNLNFIERFLEILKPRD